MTTYTIRKGEHYSDACWLRKIIPHRIDKLERTVRFTESCLNTNSNDQINKLFGFTVGLCSPLWNSVRVGWNSSNNGSGCFINLYCFWHLDRKFNSAKFATCLPNIDVTFQIKQLGNKTAYQITAYLDGQQDLIGCTSFPATKGAYPAHNYGFRLFPYFGGELPAPHDIQILMK